MKNKYQIGQFIRYDSFSFADRYLGFDEGIIVAKEDIGVGCHYHYEITKCIRNFIGDGFYEYPHQVGRIVDFYERGSRPPIIIGQLPGNWIPTKTKPSWQLEREKIEKYKKENPVFFFDESKVIPELQELENIESTQLSLFKTI